MKRQIFVLALLTAASTLALSQPVQLTAVPDRITDRAIEADLTAYSSATDRLKALNAAGRPLNSYYMAKASCWIDASLSEYSRNDRSTFPQDALNEGISLIGAMEAGQDWITQATPSMGAPQIRPDLWAMIDAMKAGEAPYCRPLGAAAACGEVELVHAAVEESQQGWRHAAPQLAIAESLVYRAHLQASQCVASGTSSAP